MKLPVTNEKQLLTDILKAFENQLEFNFSYDVTAIKNISLELQKANLSIISLKERIAQQTSYELQKVSETDFIFVKNKKVIDVCAIVVNAVSLFELPQADIHLNKKTIGLTENNGVFKATSISTEDGRLSTLPVSDNVWILSNNSSSNNPDTPRISVLKSMEFTVGGLYI